MKIRICDNYACAQRHELAGIIGSHGLLEISANQESVAKRLRTGIGNEIELFLAHK